MLYINTKQKNQSTHDLRKPAKQTPPIVQQRYLSFSPPPPDVSHLASDGLSLAVDDRIRGDDAVRLRICVDHLELDGPQSAAHQEQVALVDRTVRLQEVLLQVDVKQVSAGRVGMR